MTIELSSSFPLADLEAVLAHLATLPFGDPNFSLKRRRHQEIGRVRLPGGIDVAVKRWRRPLRLRKESPARRAANRTQWLASAEVSTPELLAVVEFPRARREQAECLVVTRWLPEHRPMNLQVADHFPYERRLRPALGELAALIARLHQRGLGHRDLRLENVLAIDAGDGRFEQLVLVDVDEVVRRHEDSLGGAARDLGNLVFHLRRIRIPDHTSLRVLVFYADCRGWPDAQARRLAAAAFRHASVRAAWRQVRRMTEWLPRLRATKSGARTRSQIHQVYGVEVTEDELPT